MLNTTSYECPDCGEHIEFALPAQEQHVHCPFCGAALTLVVDADFVDGSWRDLTRLVPQAKTPALLW